MPTHPPSGAGRSHYDELGVSPSATSAEIRAAYVALARRHHPDRLGAAAPAARDRAAERMARVNAAWTVLSDATRRAQYDALLGVEADRPTGATVRDADATFRPFDDGDDIDPRLLDDTPFGGASVPRSVAMVPPALAVAGVCTIVLSAFVGLVGMLVFGFVLLGAAGLSFLLIPLLALFNASRSDDDGRR